MVGEWLAGLEATALAAALRDSVWVYPLVNAGHILGIALLVGSIIPLDLRLLGFWQTVSLAPLWQVLTRTAAVGLALAVVFGILLFITSATDYAVSAFFVSKMAVVLVAIVNAVALHRSIPDNVAGVGLPKVKSSRRLRLAGGVSITAWLSALVLGRVVGYF